MAQLSTHDARVGRMAGRILACILIGTCVGAGSPRNVADSERAPADSVKVTVVVPKSRGTVECRRAPDGLVVFTVAGSSESVHTSGKRLLLWVQPTNPAGHGWYLQRPPDRGISLAGTNGNWQGVGQVGNVSYPPRNGQKLNLAITVLDVKAAEATLADPSLAVVLAPIGDVVGEVVDLTVALK